MVLLQKNILFQGSRGGPTFSRRGGGANFFPEGGPNANSLETHLTCDFSGSVRTWASGPPVPHLDPHMLLKDTAQCLKLAKKSQVEHSSTVSITVCSLIKIKRAESDIIT